MKNLKFQTQVLRYLDFNESYFIDYIMVNFPINSSNTLIVKVSYNSNYIYYNVGPQIGLTIKDTHDIEKYKNLYYIIQSRIEDIISIYNIEFIPDTIFLYSKVLNISDIYKNTEVISPNYKDLELKNSFLKRKDLYEIFRSKYLPLTMNSSSFGYLIEGELKTSYIFRLIENISKNGFCLEFINKIIEDFNSFNLFYKKISVSGSIMEILIFDISSQFINNNYNLFPDLKFDETVLNKVNCDSFKKISDSSSSFDNLSLVSSTNKKYFRLIFDLNTGYCIYGVVDLKINNDIFIRNIKNYSLTINKNKLIEINRTVKLDMIKSVSSNSYFRSNSKIGVLDLETFINSSGLGQVYCIGYSTIDDWDKVHTFYLTDVSQSLNSDLLIILCINDMIDRKLNNYVMYIHNMGKFDIVYIYSALAGYNLHMKKEKYKLVSTYKDGKMLKLVIKYKLNKYNEIKITFLDSVNILPYSLDILTKDYNINYFKDLFPYSFVKENTLNYVGTTPDIKYYKNISLLKYKQIYISNSWSLKEESLKYLKKDILGLLEVLDSFKTNLFIEHNLDLTKGLTISRLALNKYLQNFLKEFKIPLINKLNIFNFIYSGYYGGRTEVFKPYGVNLFYYDVNSLYPYVALNNMAGLNCTYTKSFSAEGVNLDKLFGVFKAKIKTNGDYLGILPIKTEAGLIFPNGEYLGVWPSPELQYAKKLGYTVQIIEGYNFNNVPSYFKEYVLDLFKLKSESSGTKRLVHKSLLNNLLGRFGLSIIKPITKIVNKNKLDYLISTRFINNIQEINQDSYLVNYKPLVDKDICSSHGLDYTKVLSENNNYNIEKNIDLFQDVSIIVSALITSFARVFMLETMKDIFNKGGSVYYMDTDSIVTNIPLPAHTVGKGLGQFKLEYEINEAYFISNKTYCLVLKNGQQIIKCKGITTDSLSLKDFKDMYFSNKNVYGSKLSPITELSKGSVILQEKQILIRHNVYKKREIIYDNQNLWIDTKPIYYNNIEKSIVPFN